MFDCVLACFYETLPFLESVAWVQNYPPHYEKSTHKLYWAKEIKFGVSSETTLNYNIRILGRKGTLVLNAVAGMEELSDVTKQTQILLPSVNFTQGNRYQDYQAGIDKLATYGLTGLIAGTMAAKVAAKAGIIKLLIGFFVSAKKFLAVAAIACFAWLRKFFKKG